MRTEMSIVGTTNVTITGFMNLQEFNESQANHNDGQKGSVDKDAFNQARKRFIKQGAEDVRFFPVQLG